MKLTSSNTNFYIALPNAKSWICWLLVTKPRKIVALQIIRFDQVRHSTNFLTCFLLHSWKETNGQLSCALTFSGQVWLKLNLLPDMKTLSCKPINSFLSWTAPRPYLVEFLANFVDCIPICTVRVAGLPHLKCKTRIMERRRRRRRIILVYKNSHQNNPTLLVAIKSNLHVSFCFLLLVSSQMIKILYLNELIFFGLFCLL